MNRFEMWRCVALAAALAGCSEAAEIEMPDANAGYEEVVRNLSRRDEDVEYRGQAEVIVKKMEAGMARDPLTRLARARLILADGYVGGSRYTAEAVEQAAALVDQASTMAPAAMLVLIGKGDIERYRGRFDAAERYYKEAARAGPAAAEPALGRARLALARGEPDAALKFLASVGTMHDARLQYEAGALQADAFMEAGRYEDAVRCRRKLVVERPRSPWARGNLAIALVRAGDLDAAIEEAQHALTLKEYPMARRVLAEAQYQKGRALWAAKRYEDAAPHIMGAAMNAPDCSNCLAMLGYHHERSAQFAKSFDSHQEHRLAAEAAYRRALELDQENQQAAHGLQRVQSWEYR